MASRYIQFLCHLAIILPLFTTPTSEATAICATGENCADEPPPDMARYDNYRVYYVEFTNEQQVKLFQQLEAQSDSLMFMGHARQPKQKLTIIVAAHKVADFVDLLKTYAVKYEVLSYNFQEKIERNLKEVKPKGTPPAQYDWQHFFQLETIYEWMDWMVTQHPNELTLLDMGTSTQGLPIKGLKLSKNKQNKAIFIESGIHAREWIAPATATYIINELLNSTDAAVQQLASQYNWIVFPVINPDGYKFTFEGDRMWRKNRALFGICRGVDLNRNYPAHWNTTGASGDACRYDFSGPSAASEIETQRLIEFVKNNIEKEQIKTYLALHSYSQLIMFPYGHTAAHVSNYADLTDIGRKAAEKIKALSGRIYRTGSIYETIYPSSGGSKDWAYAEMQIPITFTFELRGPFDSKDLFILPANEITPTAEEAFAAIVTIVEEAERKGYYN